MRTFAPMRNQPQSSQGITAKQAPQPMRKAPLEKVTFGSGDPSSSPLRQDFSQIPVHSAVTAAGHYEREADRIADQVMAMPAQHTSDGAPLTGRTEAAPAGAASPLSTPGRPMPPALLQDMERRFGYDFSRVRVHADERASESAAALGANAYTLGQHVVFSQSGFDPVSGTGRRLIAHELAHTIQQRGSGSQPAGNIAGPTPSGVAVACQSAGDLPQDLRDIDAQIQIVTLELQLPVQPLRVPLMARLQALQVRRSQVSAGRGGAKKEPARLSPQEQAALNEKAVHLAEKQAKRREFWDSEGDNQDFLELRFQIDDDFRQEAADLNLYWDKDKKDFYRDPKVDVWEQEVNKNNEAHQIYNSTYWNLTENKPAKKSWFDKTVGFVCDHLNPCSDNMEQFHKDLDSGMSREEALNRGMSRLVVGAALLGLPGEGPQGPIALGPDGTPAGPFFGPPGEPVPATDPAPKGVVTPEPQPAQPVSKAPATPAKTPNATTPRVIEGGEGGGGSKGDPAEAATQGKAKDVDKGSGGKAAKPAPRKPPVQPSAPPSWKGSLNAFGKEIGWPESGAAKVRANAADLAKLRKAGVTEQWAAEQAKIYREVARMNQKNPTAALRAEWLAEIAGRLRGEP